MRISDALTGLVFLALGVAVVVTAQGFPGFPGQRFGPSLFPTILGSGLALSGLLLGLRGLRAGAPALQLDADLRAPGPWITVAMVLAVVLALALFGDAVGFIPLSAAGLLALCLRMGLSPLPSVGVAVVFTALLWWFFAGLLRVPLPQGILMGVL